MIWCCRFVYSVRRLISCLSASYRVMWGRTKLKWICKPSYRIFRIWKGSLFALREKKNYSSSNIWNTSFSISCWLLHHPYKLFRDENIQNPEVTPVDIAEKEKNASNELELYRVVRAWIMFEYGLICAHVFVCRRIERMQYHSFIAGIFHCSGLRRFWRSGWSWCESAQLVGRDHLSGGNDWYTVCLRLQQMGSIWDLFVLIDRVNSSHALGSLEFCCIRKKCDMFHLFQATKDWWSKFDFDCIQWTNGQDTSLIGRHILKWFTIPPRDWDLFYTVRTGRITGQATCF